MPNHRCYNIIERSSVIPVSEEKNDLEHEGSDRLGERNDKKLMMWNSCI